MSTTEEPTMLDKEHTVKSKNANITQKLRQHCRNLFHTPTFTLSSTKLHTNNISCSVPDGLNLLRDSELNLNDYSSSYNEKHAKKKEKKNKRSRPVSAYVNNKNDDVENDVRSRKISLPSKWLSADPLHTSSRLNPKNLFQRRYFNNNLSSNPSTTSLPCLMTPDSRKSSVASIPESDNVSLSEYPKITMFDRDFSDSVCKQPETKDALSEENYSYLETQLQKWLVSTQIEQEKDHIQVNNFSTSSIVSTQSSFDHGSEKPNENPLKEQRIKSKSESEDIIQEMFPCFDKNELDVDKSSAENIKAYLKDFLEIEIQSVIMDKYYNERYIKKWCKNISTNVMNRILLILRECCKIAVNVYIGHKKETTNVSVINSCNSVKDCFVTVSFESNDMFIWVTLLVIPY